MVEIREETPEGANNETSRSNTAPTAPPPTILEYIKTNRNEALCFCLRLATIYFSFVYIVPFFSISTQKNAYVKSFVSAAATNAFRLHQRMRESNNPIFSRVFLSEIMFEDSAHYLFYCLMFALSTPVTMALVPITLYALLHGLNFSLKSATELGYGSAPVVVQATQLKTQQVTGNILSTIACAEIAIFPIFIAMIFGKANLFFPFIYYRFISMRYMSRRNPYTRETFANIKLSLFSLANSARCPMIVKNMIFKLQFSCLSQKLLTLCVFYIEEEFACMLNGSVDWEAVGRAILFVQSADVEAQPEANIEDQQEAVIKDQPEEGTVVSNRGKLQREIYGNAQMSMIRNARLVYTPLGELQK
uniref:Transmembrane protein 33 n=1 Tax=Ditylenchus dipsaci TaxID=166011 RepID=A0A915D2B7_9BILA